DTGPSLYPGLLLVDLCFLHAFGIAKKLLLVADPASRIAVGDAALPPTAGPSFQDDEMVARWHAAVASGMGLRHGCSHGHDCSLSHCITGSGTVAHAAAVCRCGSGSRPR